MDAFSGVAALLLLLLSLFVIVPAGFVLVAAFAYVRVQKGQPIDVGTGLSAYTVVLLGASALVLTLGAARLLTALMGEISFDYTYGAGEVVDLGFGTDQTITDLGGKDDRQSQDVATGLALVIGAGIAGLFHFGLRSFLKDRTTFDRGVEGAWDTLEALVLGIIVLVLVAAVFNETLSRAIVTDEGSSPGGTIATMVAFLGLWVIYGYRALAHAGMRFGRAKTSGGVPL